jgi:hypothetical protein
MTEAVSFVEVTTGKTTKVDVDADGKYEVESALAWSSDSTGLIFAASGDKADRLLYTRMARDGKLAPVDTEWALKPMWSRAGVTTTVPAQAIHWSPAGNRSTFDVIDLATGRVQASYQADGMRPDGAWLDGEHYATTKGTQVLVHDARTSGTTAVMLPSPAAGPPLFAPHAEGSKTSRLPLD